MDLPNISLMIDKDEIYEFYYMRHLHYNVDNWLFDDYDSYLEKVGGYRYAHGDEGYRQFLAEFSNQKHDRIISSLNNFIESKEYGFQKKYLK